jgi:hypothetical protein
MAFGQNANSAGVFLQKTNHARFEIRKKPPSKAHCRFYHLARLPLNKPEVRLFEAVAPMKGKAKMKTRKYLISMALGTAMLAWAGCSNNSSNPPASTNSVSSAMPSTNELVINAPPAAMTNAPTPANGAAAPNK